MTLFIKSLANSERKKKTLNPSKIGYFIPSQQWYIGMTAVFYGEIEQAKSLF